MISGPPVATAAPGQPSLQRTLLVWLMLPLLLLVPLAAALLYRIALGPALDSLDRALTDTVVALAQIVETRDGLVVLPLSAQTARALKADLVDEITFAVGDGRGGLLGGSAVLLALAPQQDAGSWRFFEGTLGDHAVRVAAHAVPCGPQDVRTCPILVAETLGKRQAARRAVLLGALSGALALALPLALLAMVAVQRAMRPLHRAARDVASRTPERLEALDPGAVPQEVSSFVVALNGLFARLREAAAAQRAFIADAAHQLRTPLSVVRLEAAQALATPHPAELTPTLARLHAAAERGARLSQQLLTLARTEGASVDPADSQQRLDLAALAAGMADRWLHPSLQAGQDLGFELQPAWVDGDRLLLEELLGNLIQNAIEHAGAGARVTVCTAMVGETAELVVVDDGPGLPAGERERVWERFHRGPAASGEGSGLGLAIVRDIARRHGARASLEAGDGQQACGGLRVRVRFAPLRSSDGAAQADAASSAA